MLELNIMFQMQGIKLTYTQLEQQMDNVDLSSFGNHSFPKTARLLKRTKEYFEKKDGNASLPGLAKHLGFAQGRTEHWLRSVNLILWARSSSAFICSPDFAKDLAELQKPITPDSPPEQLSQSNKMEALDIHKRLSECFNRHALKRGKHIEEATTIVQDLTHVRRFITFCLHLFPEDSHKLLKSIADKADYLSVLNRSSVPKYISVNPVYECAVATELAKHCKHHLRVKMESSLRQFAECNESQMAQRLSAFADLLKSSHLGKSALKNLKLRQSFVLGLQS
jgi:hypothetical protein